MEMIIQWMEWGALFSDKLIWNEDSVGFIWHFPLKLSNYMKMSWTIWNLATIWHCPILLGICWVHDQTYHHHFVTRRDGGFHSHGGSPIAGWFISGKSKSIIMYPNDENSIEFHTLSHFIMRYRWFIYLNDENSKNKNIHFPIFIHVFHGMCWSLHLRQPVFFRSARWL